MCADPILSNNFDSSNKDFLIDRRRAESTDIDIAEQYRPTNIK